MSEWDFKPDEWAGIGFCTKEMQDRICHKGRIVAIYITRDRGPEAWRGMVVGFVELSGKKGDISRFVGAEILARHRAIPGNETRWGYAVGISRAWKVVGNLQDVEVVFLNTYERREQGRYIGTFGKQVAEADFDNVDDLDVQEVKIFKPSLLQKWRTHIWPMLLGWIFPKK